MALQVKDFSLTAKSGHGKITYTYILRVTENSTDPVKNCSDVTVEAILKQTYSGTAFSGYRTGVSCDINGQNLFSDYCRRTIAGREEHVFYTWKGQLPHEADGTLTIRVKGKLWQTKAADYTPPTMNIPEGTMELTPIPRASQVGASDGGIGGRSTVVITPAAEGFTHTLGYTFGKENGYICQDGSISQQPVLLTGTAISFEIPESFYYQIPDQPSGSCILTCTTYRGETCIGTKEAAFTVTAQQSRCEPLLQVSAGDVRPETLALTGNAGVLIRYASTLRIALEAQARYGAAILRRQAGGVELTEAYLDIPWVEQGRISVFAEDSRGYRQMSDVDLPVIPYVALTNNAVAARTAPTTGQVRLTFSGNCFAGSFGAADNRLQLRYRFCPDAGQYSPWYTMECAVGQDHTYRQEILLSDLDYTKAYTIETQVADALDTAQCDIAVMPGIPVFNWYKDRFAFRVPVECDSSISGAFIRRQEIWGADTLTLVMAPGQTVFLMGADGAVCGAVGSNGLWWGSEGVAAQREEGRVVLTFSQYCSGTLLLISYLPISIE